MPIETAAAIWSLYSQDPPHRPNCLLGAENQEDPASRWAGGDRTFELTLFVGTEGLDRSGSGARIQQHRSEVDARAAALELLGGMVASGRVTTTAVVEDSDEVEDLHPRAGAAS